MKADKNAGVSETDRRLLALWAADCAERVLPLFEERCLGDGRPRTAVEIARAWARGESRVTEARAAASAAHAAARETEDAVARAAARAAGNAAATAHAAGHARAAAAYAVMAAAGAAGRPVAGLTAAGVRAGPIALTTGAVVAREHDWQYGQLPEHLRELMASSLRLRNLKPPTAKDAPTPRMTQAGPSPTDGEVAEWMGDGAYRHWQHLTGLIETLYPGVFSPEWLYGGKKHGWSLRYKKSRPLCTFVPEEGRFKLLLVFGKEERAKVEAMRHGLSRGTLEAYDAATTYHDGKWLLLAVDSDEVVQDVVCLWTAKRMKRRESLALTEEGKARSTG